MKFFHSSLPLTRLQLKRKLVYAVLASLCEIRPPGWSLSDQYLQYMSNTGGDKPPWIPDLDYYIYLVKRVVDSILYMELNSPTSLVCFGGRVVEALVC